MSGGSLKQVVFVGSHIGFPMERTPLGGGAMVGLQLARHWAGCGGFGLTVLGAGPEPPAETMAYVQLPAKGPAPDLTRFSEREYAAFCGDFETATTGHVLRNPDAFPPSRTVVVVNDISESPDVRRLAGAGFRIASIWHVDVVEFVTRIYLGGILRPERLTRLFAHIEGRGLAGLLPSILRLIFDKQKRAVESSSLMILPSRQMAEAIERCYPRSGNGGGSVRERVLVLPWGGWNEAVPEDRVSVESSRLRAHYQLRPDTRVLMTLSRISPEKGIHLLLEALRRLEGSAAKDLDVCLFVCGEPAFMRGAAYGRRVRRAAERLRRFRVFFPGYLSAWEKAAYFRLGDLFVSPSLHESYGLTLVEAMQAGLPVLASDHYGVDEILDPAYGRKVSYERAGERAGNLAAALEELLADKTRLVAMGRKAREAASRMEFSGAARRLLDAVLGLIPEGG